MSLRSSLFFASLLRRRWYVIGAAVLLIVVAGTGAIRTRIDYGVEQFFLPFGPERDAFERYRASFPGEDTRFSLFWKTHRVPGVAAYRDMERVAESFNLTGLKNVRWLGSVRVLELEAGATDEPLSLQPLIDSDRASDSTIAAALARHRQDPLLMGYLWNPSQTVFAVHGDIDPSLNTDAGRRSVEEDLTRRVDALDLDDVELVLGGLPLARSRAPKLLARDLQLLAAAAFLVSALVLLYFLRHPAQVALMLGSVVPAYLCTIGLMGWVGKPISVLTSFVPVIVLVIGMADAIHLVAEFRHRRAAGAETPNAVVETFSALALPCFYTTLTTVVGFGGLITTGIGIVVDFAVYTAVAIVLTFIFSMTLLPVLLSFTTRRVFNDRGIQARWLHWLITPAIRRARAGSSVTGGVFLLVGVVGLTLGLGLRVNTFLIDDIRRNTALMRDIRWIEREGFGLFQLAIHLQQAGTQPLHHPAALKWVDEFRESLRGEPLVQSMFALPDVILPLRQSLNGPASGGGTLPASVDEAAQLLLIADMDDPDLVRTLYREDRGEAQIIVTVRDEGSVKLAPLLGRVESYLQSHPVPDGRATLTGTVVMIQSFTARLLRNLGASVALDIVLISLVMMWMLRSVRLGLLAVIPNAFPILVVLAAMRLGGFDLKPSTILVFSIAYGLAVDNTIHLLTRFIQEMRATPGCSPLSALEHSLRTTGAALVMTSVVVAAGFAVLMVSQFQVLLLIGLMTVISGVAELAGDLYLFPPLLSFLSRRAPRLARAALTIEEAS